MKDDALEKGEAFVKPWYSSERKFLKQKLGRLYHCKLRGQEGSLCRVMNYDRISTYQIEAFFSDLARLSLYKLTNYVVMPLGVHVSNKMEITVVLPELTSLHELIYQPRNINGSDDGLSLHTKINILL